MVCVNIVMNNRNVANCEFEDNNVNLLHITYFLQEIFKNYNKNLINEELEEVLAVKMLIGGYQNFFGYGKHIDFPDASKKYLEKEYPGIFFCKTNKKTSFYINVDFKDIEKALLYSKYIVTINMDKKNISHNLYQEFEKTVASDMNILNAKFNNFPICDIDTLQSFLLDNMERYFLDEDQDKAYFVRNTTFF